MPREYEEVKEYHEEDRIRYEHPSFAQISVTRRTGRTNLFGSDFDHDQCVSVQINRAYGYRRYAEDTHQQSFKDTIVEFQMSEAQWASFVSSIGMGSGTQITLSYANGHDIPSIPEVKAVAPKYKEDARKTAQKALNELDTLVEKVNELKISDKQKKELIGHIEISRMNVKANLSFILSQFGEYIEHTLVKAKTEINAYAQSVITRTGIAALLGNKNTDVPKVITFGGKKDAKDD